MDTNAYLAIYVAGLMIVGLFYFWMRANGPWSRKNAKVPVRTRKGQQKQIQPPEEDNSMVESFDWFLLSAFVILFFIGLVGLR